MVRNHAGYRRLAAGLAAASILGACSSGGVARAAAGRRPGSRSAPPTPATTSGRGVLSAGLRCEPEIGGGADRAGTELDRASASILGPSRRWSRRATGAQRRRRAAGTCPDPDRLRQRRRRAEAPRRGDGETAERPRDTDRARHRARPAEPACRGAGDLSPGAGALSDRLALLSNLGLSLGLSGHTTEGITILRELVRDGAATAKTRGNLALVYGLAGRDREATAALSAHLSSSQIQNNLAYYRELRSMLLQGKPIGNLDQPTSRGARASHNRLRRFRPQPRRRSRLAPRSRGSRRRR